MRATHVRFPDLLTYLRISGIPLLTRESYVETTRCRRSVNNGSLLPADETGDEVEADLRHVLRELRLLPRPHRVHAQQGKSDGCR